MRSIHQALIAVVALLASAGGSALAQYEACTVVIEGQNRNRTVDGRIDAECRPVVYPTQWHDPPWGNWGVSSNYGRKRDTDQFKGWKPKDGKYQWNSCTVRANYFPPHRDFYSPPDYRSQRSPSIVTHGKMGIRNDLLCPINDRDFDPPIGCTSAEGHKVTESTNYMTIYELDRPDRDDLIETLYFPATKLKLTSCTYSECPERTSDWVAMQSSTSRTAIVEAELRMKIKAEVSDECDWDWPR